MDLQNISNNELINRMQKLVRTERKITHLVLLHILEIESRRIYAELGYDGMYTYLTRGLGYSEASAYRRLQSARLLKRVPELSEKIEAGTLHLSQLTRVQKCLKESAAKGSAMSTTNTLKLLEKIENKNSFQTEAILAKEFQLPVKADDTLKPQADDSVRLEITLGAEQFKELQKAKDLLSHICPNGSWSEIIAMLAMKFNKKNEGAESKSQVKFEKSTNNVAPRVIATNSFKRGHIAKSTRRRLLKKSGSCCEYVQPHSGLRCNSSYQLQVDHRIPIAVGGADDPANLRVLCRTHNLHEARIWGLL